MRKATKSKKSSLSKSEYLIIEKLLEKNLIFFNIETLERITGKKKAKLYGLVNSLKKKGFFEKIGNNYILHFHGVEADVMEIAPKIIWPSYVSFWTALNYYKFTEQLPATLFVANAKQRKVISCCGKKISYIKIHRKRFFGYTRIGSITIAEPEKALIDSLFLSRYAGGIDEIFKCLKNAWDEIDKKIFFNYALKMENKSLLKRIGFLIEKGNLKADSWAEKIKKKIGKGYSKLEPASEKKGKRNKRWQLIINTEAIE